MAKKIYGQKHKADNLSEETKNFPIYEALLPPKRAKSPYEAELMDILLSPENFKKDFIALSLEKQLALIKLLYQTSEYGKQNSLTGVAKDFAEAAGYHLHTIHQYTGMTYDEGIYYKIAKDEKRLIRMDCYGCINKRQPHQLSAFYKYFLKTENRGQWPLDAYELNKSPMWRVFMQFAVFRKITPVIQKYLHRRGINPEALKVMRVNDFCDTVFNAFKTSNDDIKVSFVKESESIKAKFVKAFMQVCGDKYQKMLLQEGYRPEAVYSMCNAMKRHGVTDPSSVTVTSLTYTPRIIADLQKAGYNIPSSLTGAKIHRDFVDYLLEHHQEKLIQARDEDGNPITAEDLPHLQFHHLEAVMFAGSKGYIASTNYLDKGLLVDSRIHSGYIHLFDNIIKQNDELEQYYSRLNAENKNMCLMIGFSPRQKLFADFTNNLEFVKQANEDKKYVVKYFDMMQEVLQNEALIAEKYGINYSRTAVTQVLDDIKKIKEYPEVDMQKVKTFESWFKKTHIKSRKEKKKQKSTAITTLKIKEQEKQ